MFLTVNVDEQDSERSTKSLEQQKFELQKFEELKDCYQVALNYIKTMEIAEAANVLINLYDSDLFVFKSFEAKQLQKAVLKLLLSLNTCSSERQLAISLKGLELFPDEKCFWEHCGELLIQSGKHSDAVQVYEFLFKSDPFSSKYLASYASCLTESFMFVELDVLLESLKQSNWIDAEIFESFNWRKRYPELIEKYLFDTTMKVIHSENKSLETLNVPIRGLNWSNYASSLHSMASGDYTKVFKKQPFNPENYCILNGPCYIEATNTQNPSSGNTQSLLMNSILEYSASSMEDISTQSMAKRSLRRKETRPLQNSQVQKVDLTAADLVKNLKFFFEEQDIVNTLCSTERSCLQLLDKNNMLNDTESIEGESPNSDLTFTVDSLMERIQLDNEISKPLALRIFDLIDVFFVKSLECSFPSPLTSHMIDLVNLFKNHTFSFQNLKDFLGVDNLQNYHNLLLGICEVYWDNGLKDQFSHELALINLERDRLSLQSRLRLDLLEILSNPTAEEVEKQGKLEAFSQSISTTLFTRLSINLPNLIDREVINLFINGMLQSISIKEAENLVYIESKHSEALEMFRNVDMLGLIDALKGDLKLRMCKLAIALDTDSNHRELIAEKALESIINSHSNLDIKTFSDFLAVFIEVFNFAQNTRFTLNLYCIFWNIYSRKQLITAHSTLSVLNGAFASFLNRSLGEINVGFSRFILQWMAQEKVFGVANGLVPLKLFRHYALEPSLPDLKFAYMIIHSLFRFPNVFIATDAESGWEEWDRAPVGLGTRDSPCPSISDSDLLELCGLVHRFDTLDEQEEESFGLRVSEPGFVYFVDWFKKQFADLQAKLPEKNFFRCLQLNRSQITRFLTAPIDQHAQKQVLNLARGHFNLPIETDAYRYLLNTRSDLVYSELQGRKKSLDILKTIRSDLKLSLAMSISDASIWKSLGICYYDAAVHYLSSEAEFISENCGKIKRMIKKAILALQQSIRFDSGSDRESWTKLMDLCDWSLHDPAFIGGSNPEITGFICSIGCSCVQTLLPGVVSRDRWVLFLRLELFLRRAGAATDPNKQLELLKEASISACTAYSENVYESTALYMSLVKFYSRLSKLFLKDQLSNQDVIIWLGKLEGHLPSIIEIAPIEVEVTAVNLLQNHLEALNVLDRKKIFHAHVTAAATNSWKLLNDPQRALLHYQQLFPFLKTFSGSKKNSSVSLMQIYQCDHERPARYLVAGRRYLLELLDFIETHSQVFESPLDLITQFLKKLHYIRRTVLGFPEILAKASMTYLMVSRGCPDLAILNELRESLSHAFNGEIPLEIEVKFIEAIESDEVKVNEPEKE